jgi:cell division protein FtsB
MRDFQERGKIRRLLESRPILILLAGILLFSLWNVFGFWRKMSETEKNRQIAEEKATELEANKAHLESEIQKLESKRGVEEVLREDYGLSREGEGVIVIVEDQNKADKEEDEKGFWAWWKNLFK